MKRIFKIVAALVLGGTFLSACYYDHWEAIHPTSGLVDVCPDSVSATYAAAIRFVTAQNCVSCHNSSRQDGNIVLETYDQVKSLAATTKFLNSIQRVDGSKPMPPGVGLKACEITKIQTWITNGMPN
ncbi:MAG: hypothetical protein K1X47_11075 [Cyclobacteriaceae bacterium]|nr:hypothetical protein [Cyclobacteriaceae bacterium]